VDRIEPIRPRSPAPEPIPGIKRTDRSGERRERQDPEQRRDRREPPAEPPPDDGLPHIDVRV
jgi:hypothetical protein